MEASWKASPPSPSGGGAGMLKNTFWPSAAAFDVEHLGEALRVVAGHHDLGAVHLVEHVFALEQALRQLGMRQREEGVELRFVLVFLLPAARHYDAARSDIEAERLVIVLFGLTHNWLLEIGITHTAAPRSEERRVGK